MSDSHWFRRNVVTVSLCYSGNSVGVTILLHLVGIPRSQEPKKIWDSLICLIFIKFFERSNQIYWEDLSIWERARLALRVNKYEMMKRSGKIELGLIDFIQQKEMEKSHSDKLTEIWPDITIKNDCLEISRLEFKLAKTELANSTSKARAWLSESRSWVVQLLPHTTDIVWREQDVIIKTRCRVGK